MIVVPQVSFHGAPSDGIVRQLAGAGAREIQLIDLDGALAARALPDWLGALIDTAGVPLRFDGRVREGARIERLAGSGFATIVIDQHAVFEPVLLRWALDLLGPRLAVCVQLDDGYVFDAPPAAFGHELVDVLSQLHLRGVRRLLLRDVTGDELPTELLRELRDRLPGMRFTVQGAVRSNLDVARLAALGPAIEAVLVDAADVVAGRIAVV